MPERAQGTPGLRPAAAQEVGRRDLTALAFERRRHSTGCCCYYQHPSANGRDYKHPITMPSRSSIRNRRHKAPAAAQEAGRCDLTALALECRRSAERLQCEGDETANDSSAPCWYKLLKRCAICRRHHQTPRPPLQATGPPKLRTADSFERDVLQLSASDRRATFSALGTHSGLLPQASCDYGIASRS